MILITQLAKGVEKKKSLESPTGIAGRKLNKGHKRPHNKQRADSIPITVCKSSRSGQPTSASILEDEPTYYMSEGEDTAGDEIYDSTEPQETYLYMEIEDDTYQSIDITNTNIDNTEAYAYNSSNQPSVPKSNLPRPTPQIPGGKQSINAAAERLQDYAYSDSDSDPKLQQDESESDEVYELID